MTSHHKTLIVIGDFDCTINLLNLLFEVNGNLRGWEKLVDDEVVKGKKCRDNPRDTKGKDTKGDRFILLLPGLFSGRALHYLFPLPPNFLPKRKMRK